LDARRYRWESIIERSKTLINLIAIGANLASYGNKTPLATCQQAAEALKRLDGLTLTALSYWYETPPHPPSDQPNYINGVARLDGMADPADLLRALQAIEHEHGRERSVANAARTLDLDIIAMGDLVRDSPDPVLPHPRMHERAFVLRPLLDVAPEWRHPVLGRTARALLDGLPGLPLHPIARSHLRDGGVAPN
jgi:2-amino-4-hydroxy-6-hydroxymethyldihydropteridine diphosphokinase